jgi:hypothetical protein
MTNQEYQKAKYDLFKTYKKDNFCKFFTFKINKKCI